MMRKGLITQGVCVLFNRAPSLDSLEAALGRFDVRDRCDANELWAWGGPTLLVAYRPECNGAIAVDTVEQSWPDHMGDTEREPMIFGAWSMGQFGPFTFPGALGRAAEQCRTRPQGPTVSERHAGFVRVRSSFAFGNGDAERRLPDTYEPVAELQFVTRIAASLLELPGALCYFNPNGEVLLEQDGLRAILNRAWVLDHPPLEAWSNTRLFNVSPEWSLMDTVGNGQLDVSDVEACFHTYSYSPTDVESFLRRVSRRLLRNGGEIQDGELTDGPGGIHWRATLLETGVCDPPRPVLRWLPLDRRCPPAHVLDSELYE